MFNEDGSTVISVDQADLKDVTEAITVFGANCTDNSVSAEGQILEHTMTFTDSEGNAIDSFSELSTAHEHASILLDDQSSFGIQASVLGFDFSIGYDSADGFQQLDYEGASATLLGLSVFYKAYSNNIDSSGNGLSLGLSKHLGLSIDENSTSISLGIGIGSVISPFISADTILEQ